MKYSDELQNVVLAEDFYGTEDILSKIKSEDDSLDYVDFLLKIMELHPNLDYGVPGPVVHFVERYFQKGYEELLLSSVSSKPTVHTLWMLNRVINSPLLPDRDKYFSALRNVSEDESVSADVREEAKRYLAYQEQE